jgi:hypothetical protein
LEFTGRLIDETPQLSMWGAPDKQKRKLADHLKAITLLKDCGLHGTSVIRVYHVRRVVPLMARALSLYEMTLDARLGGMVLAEGSLRDTEIM